LLFLWVLVNVLSQGPLTHLNAPVYHFLQSIRIKPLDNFLITMTLLGDKHVLLIVAGIVLLFLCWRRRWWAALHLFAITILGTASVEIFKRLFYSPRPDIVQTTDPSSSFPSGHALLSISILGFVAVLLAENLPAEKRKYVYYTVTLTVLLIALSRVYL